MVVDAGLDEEEVEEVEEVERAVEAAAARVDGPTDADDGRSLVTLDARAAGGASAIAGAAVLFGPPALCGGAGGICDW